MDIIRIKKGLSFGEAISFMKSGEKVARQGWNGKGMYLWLKEGVEIHKSWCKDPMLLETMGDSDSIIGLPTVCMYTHDSTGRKAVLTGWLASQSDMLSNDWYVVD
jgi:hypothetical protein